MINKFKKKPNIRFYWQEFSEEAEIIFDKSQRAVDLHRNYRKIVEAIFRGIEQCAVAMGNDAKTPHSMVRLGGRQVET